MREKQIYLMSRGEEGAKVIVYISPYGIIRVGFVFREKQAYSWKNKIRTRDNSWVYHNIPSSIAWKTETHHDWKNGGVMYLLAPQEHKKITKEESGR